jgi:hypothetical protein
MVFIDGNIKEEVLKRVPLLGKARREEDMFQSCYVSLFFKWVLSLTTYGTSAMTSENMA